MPRKLSVQFLPGMGNQKSSSKGGDHFEGGLLSEFQKSTSIRDKLTKEYPLTFGNRYLYLGT